jgi:hypothetical protein
MIELRTSTESGLVHDRPVALIVSPPSVEKSILAVEPSMSTAAALLAPPTKLLRSTSSAVLEASTPPPEFCTM